MQHHPGKVEVWRETVMIPTYGIGEPDKNPMFLEKRVYQGSSGKVYLYPVIDKILDEKQDCPYQAVFLENDYLRVMILPELGGRIQRAYDKTNGYDFVYYNHAIKPALMGLTGPWISGGIEFNRPQHHRPTTYAPTDCVLEQNASTEAVLGLDVQAGEAHVGRSLVKNAHNLKARGLRAQILLQLGRNEAALTQLEKNLRLDPFDYRSRLVREIAEGLPHDETLALMGNRASSFIECAIDFAEAGFYTHAIETLRLCSAASPMLKYYEAFYLEQNGNSSDAAEALSEAANRSPRCCFPNRLEDVKVLSFALNRNQTDARAPYYLGCLFYDKRRYEEAQHLWELSAQLDDRFPTVWRNLSLVYYNQCKEPQKARSALERAFALDVTDARVLLELDQLYKKLGIAPSERLEHLRAYEQTMLQRDDLCAEFITLLNLTGRFEEAYAMLMQRHFHPWEAAEGDSTPAGAMYYNDQPADMILYRGLAHEALGCHSEALKRFHQLVDYGETHLFDEVRIDYFAVSLPELQLFEEDLTTRNKLHCRFLIGLGCLGLGETARAEQELAHVLKSNPAHTGAVWMTHPERNAFIG